MTELDAETMQAAVEAGASAVRDAMAGVLAFKSVDGANQIAGAAIRAALPVLYEGWRQTEKNLSDLANKNFVASCAAEARALRAEELLREMLATTEFPRGDSWAARARALLVSGKAGDE